MEKIAINKYRNVDNGSLRIEDAGKTVKLAGWVDTIRNFGELTFVVLRDTYGKTQIVLNKEFIPLSKEDVISMEIVTIELNGFDVVCFVSINLYSFPIFSYNSYPIIFSRLAWLL